MNASKDEVEATILSSISKHYVERPDHKVISWVDARCNVTEILTYRKLWGQSGVIANHLKNELGLIKGDRVMIVYPCGFEFLVAMIGCMRVGIIPCSVYIPNPKKNFKNDLKTLALQARDAGSSIILTTRSYKLIVCGLMLTWLHNKPNLKWIATDSMPSSLPGITETTDVLLSAEDIAFIQYTSGSTGVPKGVMISHRSLLGNVKQYTKISLGDLPPEVAQGFVTVNWCPQYHDLGLIGCFMMNLFAGFIGYNASPLDFIKRPLLWHEMIMKFGGRATQGPNFAFGLVMKRLRQAKLFDKKWTTVHRVCIGAEPVDPNVLKDMTSFLGISESAIQVGYGMAEVGLFISNGDGVKVQDGIPSSGNVDAFSMMRIVQNGEVICKDGEVGEIYVQSPVVASGYWNKEELTRETFHNVLDGEHGEWLASGDLGKVIDNNIFITGRKKEVVIVNGKNHFPIDIERTIEQSFPSSVRPGCVAAFQHTRTSAGVVVEIRKGTTKAEIPTPMDIRMSVSSRHELKLSYCYIVKDHTLPKTTSGKLKRNETMQRSIGDKWPKTAIVDSWIISTGIKEETRQACGISYPTSLCPHFNHDDTNGARASPTSTVCCPYNAQDGGISRLPPCDVVVRDLPSDHPPVNEDPFKVGKKHAYHFYGLCKFFSYYGNNNPYDGRQGYIETASIDYKTIIPQLQSLGGRLNRGEIKRTYVLGLGMMHNLRFWTQVPGIPPHCMVTGLVGDDHIRVRSWLKTKLHRIPDILTLQASARDFISNNASPRFDTKSIYLWICQVLFQLFFDRVPSRKECLSLAEFRGRVFEMAMREHTEPGDERILQDKAKYIALFMKDGKMSMAEACYALDVFIINASQPVVGIRAGLAVLYGSHPAVKLSDSDFVLDETNAMQFVWECIRRFPMVTGMGWWEGDRIPGTPRHCLVLAMAGMDKSVWGEDVDDMNPERFSKAEFAAKSCFFAEQSPERCCPVRSGAIRMMSAFFTEFARLGIWKCHRESEYVWYDAKPYVGPDVQLWIPPTVTVVGGGVAGLTCALTLAQRGLKVTLVEKNKVIGGHARHMEVFGHTRNPAFGYFNDHQYPNLLRIIESFGVDKIPVCLAKDTRRNLTKDGCVVDEPIHLRSENMRFMSEMSTIYANSENEYETIGEYFETQDYGEEFILHVFIGKIVHFFPGLSIEQYLEMPLHLIAWVVVGDILFGSEFQIYRLRNEQYMESFRSNLESLGVRILSSINPRLWERDEGHVMVTLQDGGESTTETQDGTMQIRSDFLVVATPPNAAADFLGDHISEQESILQRFDCPVESVVLHQDDTWITNDKVSALYGMIPGKDAFIPTRQSTIPLTTLAYSDTDGETPIFVTHSYQNYEMLDIQGPKRYMNFTHTRITPDTVRYRDLLLNENGKRRTYFAGGWTQGFMLHEDAIVSGMKTANSILALCGEKPHQILPRAVELKNHSQVSQARSPVASSSSCANATAGQIIRHIIEDTVGFPIQLSSEVGSLGLGSAESLALHSRLVEEMNIDTERFPITYLFGSEMLLSELISNLVDIADNKLPTEEENGLLI